MKLREFVRNKSFDQIKNILTEKPYNCIIRETDDYYLIHYNMIESDFNIPMIHELRGIILDKKTNEIVCYPFNKFFNYGEPHASKIEWSSALVTEKIDGSMIKLWYHNSIWHISTMSTIDAENAKIPDLGDCPYHSFKDLVVKAFENNNFDYTSLDKSYTHIFEVVSPHNKVVIYYPDINIYYLGSRHIKKLEEGILDIPLPRPKEYEMKSLEEVILIG